jgi:hypothetical protein
MAPSPLSSTLSPTADVPSSSSPCLALNPEATPFSLSPFSVEMIGDALPDWLHFSPSSFKEATPGSMLLSFVEVIRDKGKAPAAEVIGDISPLHGVGSSNGAQPLLQLVGRDGSGFMARCVPHDSPPSSPLAKDGATPAVAVETRVWWVTGGCPPQHLAPGRSPT